MFEIAEAAVQGAVDAGAAYADARVVASRSQDLHAQNGTIERLVTVEKAGVGVRALMGSSWGFYAVAGLGVAAARDAGARAARIARASATVAGPGLQLADVEVARGEYATPYEEHPFDVSLSEKADVLVKVIETMQSVAGIGIATASFRTWDTDKWFVSSQGHRIHQQIVETGGGMAATAIGETETQTRSYPQSFGQFETGGYEVFRRFDLAANAGRTAEEAAALLDAQACPAGKTTLILDGSQLALQIHESVGHAIELDRILGWEAAMAGTSFLDLANLGTFRYGSPVMNITADATILGALGTFGYDDEGTPAQPVDIVRDGIWVGVLSGRDSAPIAGVRPGGMVRADGYNRLPMVRMTNVGLLAGDASLEEMIAETKDGVYCSTNRSWSIDDRRLNFQFGCEIGWEIKNGKLGRMLRNPTYTGITPQFWASLDMLAGEDERVHWGTSNCGKGQPMQAGHTGHSASPGRFQNVRVGVLG
ncbi:protease TldD [bacterium BMS3Abin02]|nr:protease TldD [bacterium BMS3Abin02]